MTKNLWKASFPGKRVRAFSYGHSQIDRVYQYILTQEQHHQKKSFKEEYIEFLHKFEIEYDEKYLFEWNDDEWCRGIIVA